MFAKQKNTYLIYTRGLMPEDLTLGSLHLDPANPTDHVRKSFRLEPPLLNTSWTGRPQVDAPYSLKTRVGSEWLLGAGILGLVKANIGPKDSVEVEISGKSGIRFEIRDSERLLNEVVLESEAARSWLATYLSISQEMSTLARLQKTVRGPPKIWMVTGLQFVSGATITSQAFESFSGSLKGVVPLPSVMAGVTELPAVDFAAAHNTEEGSKTEYGHADARIWAAQFTGLKVKFFKDAEIAGNVGKRAYIRLHDLPDIGAAGTRADREEAEKEGQPLDTSAEVMGLEEGNVEADQADSSVVLDQMLDVNWGLLDSYLDHMEEEEEEEDLDNEE